jgi:hypothetical protein
MTRITLLSSLQSSMLLARGNELQRPNEMLASRQKLLNEGKLSYQVLPVWIFT